MALIIVAIVLLPLIFLFMRDDPSEVGLEPYGAGDPKISGNTGAASLRGMSAKTATITAREIIGHPTFWLLAGSFFVCGGTANGLIGTHLIPHEIEIGIPQIAAASLLEHGRDDLLRLDGRPSQGESVAGSGLCHAGRIAVDLAIRKGFWRASRFCDHLWP
jgi:hypothetical protein